MNLYAILAALQLTSGGFTSVAAFGTEYSRRGQNEVMEKGGSFYKEVAIA